jgi:hypothetical protein
MAISKEQFVKLIKDPVSKSVVEMREHERTIAIYSTGQGQSNLFAEYKTLYEQGLHSTIDKEFAIHTKKLLAPNTGSVHSHYKKIYNSLEGRNNDYNFTDSNNYVDFINYLRNAFLSGIDNVSFSKEYLSSDILYNPNTRYYIDFNNDNEQTPSLNFELSNPIVKRVTCDFIHCVKENDSETEYIVFFEKDEKTKDIKKYFLIDNEKYATAEKLSSGNYNVTEYPHNFKKTPVTAASNSKMYTKERFEVKKSVISDSICDLRNWNLIKNQAKIYFYRNQTPMHYEIGDGSLCNETGDDGNTCSNGFVMRINKDYDSELRESSTNQEYIRTRCPACERQKRQKMLFGRNIKIDQRLFFQNSKEVSNIKDLFGFVTTDVEMLRFSEEKLANDLESIETAIIGRANVTTKEAINEKLVKQNGESKEQTLTSFAENVEQKEMFLYDCLGFGRFENSYLYSDVFLGRQYVFDEKQLVEEVKALRESNASLMLIKQKESEIIKSRYGYDKDLVNLVAITNAVIPFQDMNLATLLANKPILNEQDFYFRLYADKLITYLKNELKNDSSFMLLTFEQQVEFTTEKFKNYITQNIQNNGETTNENNRTTDNGIENGN